MKKSINIATVLTSSIALALVLAGCSSAGDVESGSDKGSSNVLTLPQNSSVDTTSLNIGFTPDFKLDGWESMEIPAEEKQQYEDSSQYRSTITIFKQLIDSESEDDSCYITAETGNGDTMPGLEGSGDDVLTQRHVQNRGGTVVGPVTVASKDSDSKVELLKYTFQEDAQTIVVDNTQESVDMPASDSVYYIRALDIKPENSEDPTIIPLLQVTYSCTGKGKIDQKVVDKIEKSMTVSGVTAASREG